MQPADCLQAVFGVAAALLGLFAGIAVNWREIRSLVIRDEAKQEVREIGRELVESADDVGLDPETVERIGEHLAARGDLEPEALEREAERAEER